MVIFIFPFWPLIPTPILMKRGWVFFCMCTILSEENPSTMVTVSKQMGDCEAWKVRRCSFHPPMVHSRFECFPGSNTHSTESSLIYWLSSVGSRSIILPPKPNVSSHCRCLTSNYTLFPTPPPPSTSSSNRRLAFHFFSNTAVFQR